MCAWTHTADGKPISKNFQDRADYMVSGTAKIDITKEHFRIQDSVSDPTAHSVVMATDKLEDNVPLTDQRGGPVTQLQLDDAVAYVEAYLEYVDNNIVHNDGINGEEWISAQFFFYDKDANPAAETDGEAVEKELAQPVSISVGRTAAEECEWLWKNAPVQFEESCKEFGCTPEEMIALAEKDPEAYYKYRNAYGYGDEEFGCYACEAEAIDTPVNNIKDVTKLDNEGLGVARTDTATGERLAAVEAGELGVLSRDTNDYEASITLRSPNLFDTTVLGLHEPEVHVHSKVGTSQVQRYFTFPTNGGVIATQPKAWTLVKEFNAESPITDEVEYPLDLSGKSEIIFGVLGVGSGAATIDEETNEENAVNLTGYFMWDSDFDDGGAYTSGAGRNSSTAMLNAIEGAATTQTCCGIGHFWDIGIGVSSTGSKCYYTPILTAPQNSYGSGTNGSGNHCHLVIGKNIPNITGIKFYGAAAISADNYWHIRIYAR